MPHHDDELEEAQKRAEQSRKQTEMGGRFRLPEGTTLLRLLYTPGDKERKSPAIYKEYQVHRNVGPNKRFATCGNAPGETGKCWLCKKRAQKEKEGRTKEAAALAPMLQLAVQVAVFDKDTDDWVGPLLWDMASGKTADSLGYKIRGVISSKRRAYLDNKAGYNFEIKRKGTGIRNTRYGDIDPDDEKTAVSKGVLKKLKPFADLNMYSYDEDWQKDIYYGREKEKEKENEDMAAKKKSKKAKEEEASSSSSEASSSETSASEASGSEASGSEASGSEASGSEASGSEASSSSSEASSSSSEASGSESDKKKKKKKKEKKEKKESSSSEASSSEASGSEASGSESSSSEASGSEASGSEASGSEASGSEASGSESDKKKKKKGRKPRSDKGKARTTKTKKKKTKK